MKVTTYPVDMTDSLFGTSLVQVQALHMIPVDIACSLNRVLLWMNNPSRPDRSHLQLDTQLN